MPPSGTPFTDGSQLARRLMWYGAAAGVAGLAASDAQAQIVYRDLVPDLVVQNTPEPPAGPSIDFDNDGDPEILLRELPTSNYSLTNKETVAGPDVITGGVASLVAGYTYWTPMAAGAAISAATVRTLGARLFQSFTFGSSDPNGWVGTEAFLGLQFTLQTGTHYGWARIQFPANGQYIVKDLAYNATPNAPINAGQTSDTAVEPDALPQGYLFSEVAPNPVVGRSAFNVAVGRPEHVRVDVIDVTGRQVATLADRTLPALEQHRIEFDATALPTGVYVVRVAGESFVTTRRVVVAH